MGADLTRELGDLIRKSLPAELGDSLRAELTALQGAREKLEASTKNVERLEALLAGARSLAADRQVVIDANKTRERTLAEREAAVQKRENNAAILEATAANEKARREDTFRLVETLVRAPGIRETVTRSEKRNVPFQYSGGGGSGYQEVQDSTFGTKEQEVI